MFPRVITDKKQKNRKYHQQQQKWLSDLLQCKYWIKYYCHLMVDLVKKMF